MSEVIMFVLGYSGGVLCTLAALYFMRGATKPAPIEVEVPVLECPRCEGQGWCEGALGPERARYTCSECHGTGVDARMTEFYKELVLLRHDKW